MNDGGDVSLASMTGSRASKVIWLTMLLVVILILVGMIMDPYGAVILVTITLLDSAFSDGIDPLYLWMVTLIAFELRYLSPPAALNHLLTWQVVGDDEVEQAGIVTGSFWQRQRQRQRQRRQRQRFALPMAITLLLTVFVPLLFSSPCAGKYVPGGHMFPLERPGHTTRTVAQFAETIGVFQSS